MSIVVVVKVSEGLVLGADSAATLTGQVRDPQGTTLNGVLKTFYNAKKLLQIGDFPIGVLSWGNAFIGPRTLESHIREWEHEQHWSSIEDLTALRDISEFKVRDCAEELRTHLLQVYAQEYGNQEQIQEPATGVIVAGYSKGAFFPEIWRFVVPTDREVHNQRPDRDGKPDFGASWFGVTEPIVRLHFGRDAQLPQIIAEKFDIPLEEIEKELSGLQYPIAFPQMPLQDAINYANYMLNVVIGRYRFVMGAELCGGQIDIAVITENKFEWIAQKSWRLE